MKEKYSNYNFRIKKCKPGYDYEIYGVGCQPYDDGIIESDEWYDTEEEARESAIKHIDRLESGEQ